MILWACLAVLYVLMFFWLGLSTLRNGHGWLFFLGIFFPILWIFGAFSGGPTDLEPAPRGGDPRG
jgi:hypothetical protein